ncbi:MAG: ThuA domain-containing protein [Clostridia bacterium]|nr:ThuA domain-containing protein [Clostridia bacterium]
MSFLKIWLRVIDFLRKGLYNQFVNHLIFGGVLSVNKIRVTIFNENMHDKTERILEVYPNGMHGAIKECLDADGRFETTIALQDMPEHGLTDEVLNNTDVLFWWGHMMHHEVDDAVVQKVYDRVIDGMGLVVLHSGHYSKIFKKLLGTGCDLKWRETGDLERIWVLKPSHPIAAGLDEYFELPHEETYGEHFAIPTPDDLVFMSWFSGGEVFRSGCCYERGNGKIFYFRPGHESFPTFYDANIRKVLVNSALWAATDCGKKQTYGHWLPDYNK